MGDFLDPDAHGGFRVGPRGKNHLNFNRNLKNKIKRIGRYGRFCGKSLKNRKSNIFHINCNTDSCGDFVVSHGRYNCCRIKLASSAVGI